MRRTQKNAGKNSKTPTPATPAAAHERRLHYPRADADVYRLVKNPAIFNKERRHDELERLRDACEQKKLWRRTVLFCAALNLLLLALALWGWLS